MIYGNYKYDKKQRRCCRCFTTLKCKVEFLTDNCTECMKICDKYRNKYNKVKTTTCSLAHLKTVPLT